MSSGLLKISAIGFAPFSNSNKIGSGNQLDGRQNRISMYLQQVAAKDGNGQNDN